MKKSTKTTSKTPAPAPKSPAIAAPAPKAVIAPAAPAAKAVVAPAPAPKPARTPAPKKAPAKAAPAAVAPAPAAPAAPVASAPAEVVAPKKPVVTTITAVIDIGFGNTLFLRGDGPGLSWDKGVPLACVADDKWKVAVADAARPVIFKFLVNDLTWSAGPDYSVEPGTDVTLVPTFED